MLLFLGQLPIPRGGGGSCWTGRLESSLPPSCCRPLFLPERPHFSPRAPFPPFSEHPPGPDSTPLTLQVCPGQNCFCPGPVRLYPETPSLPSPTGRRGRAIPGLPSLLRLISAQGPQIIPKEPVLSARLVRAGGGGEGRGIAAFGGSSPQGLSCPALTLCSAGASCCPPELHSTHLPPVA